MNHDTLALVAEEVRRRLTNQGAGHGFDHIERVVAIARQINTTVGADATVVDLAALLHDVGDAKFHQGQERSGELSAEILAQLGVASSVIDDVVAIVDNISFRKRHSAAPLSIEGKVVQDADRLDALGAIGIVRTIEYGASIGQPFYLPENPAAKATGVGHFHEKLFKLHDLMNTAEGKRLALQRESFMREFIQQLESELSLSWR